MVKKGDKLSEEHKAKIKAASQEPWTEERREAAAKRAGARTGWHHSDESKAKIAAARKDRELSDEHRKAISRSLEGNQRSAGRKLTPEHKAKISAAGKKRMQSEETRKIIGEKSKAAWAKRRAERGPTPPLRTKDYYRVFDERTGKNRPLHRVMMEQELGRDLLSSEKVHHIDGDKLHNELDNFWLADSSSAHRQAHSSLEGIAFRLVQLSLIRFNRDSGTYFLDPDFENTLNPE